MIETPEFVEAVILVKHGVSEDLAFSMPPEVRFAWMVVIARTEGSDWDWEARCWRRQPQ